MNTLFENNMDIEQPDMFTPYQQPDLGEERNENRPFTARPNIIAWDYDPDGVYPTYYVKTDDGKMGRIEVYDSDRSYFIQSYADSKDTKSDHRYWSSIEWGDPDRWVPYNLAWSPVFNFPDELIREIVDTIKSFFL